MKALKYLIIITVLLSCEKKNEPQPQPNYVAVPDPYCLSSAPVPGILPIGDTCDTAQMAMNPDPSFWCDVIHVDTLLLSEISKCWIPQFKFDIGEIFEYKNSSNQTIELTLTDKNHVLAQRILDSEECDSSEYNLGLCYDIEAYYITLENEEKSIKIYIEMGIDLFRNPDPEYHGKPDIELRILRINSNGYQGTRLRAEEFDTSPNVLSKFEEEKALLDRTFQNVYKASNYYYTKEIGLIAFNHGNGTNNQWVLQD